MCGRFAFKMTWRELHDLLRFGRFPPRLEAELKPSYNVAPTHTCVLLTTSGGERTLALSRWGFVPSWWKQPEPPRHAINARCETAATSGLFRGAFKASRCIVPVSGFFEWQVRPDATKQPVYISRADAQPLLLAGLHDEHEGADSFAILTTAAPHGLESVHDRSPVVLEPEDIDRWLSPDTPAADVQALCRPAADGVLRWHRVTTAVGNVRNNSPELIEPV